MRKMTAMAMGFLLVLTLGASARATESGVVADGGSAIGSDEGSTDPGIKSAPADDGTVASVVDEPRSDVTLSPWDAFLRYLASLGYAGAIR